MALGGIVIKSNRTVCSKFVLKKPMHKVLWLKQHHFVFNSKFEEIYVLIIDITTGLNIYKEGGLVTPKQQVNFEFIVHSTLFINI